MRPALPAREEPCRPLPGPRLRGLARAQSSNELAGATPGEARRRRELSEEEIYKVRKPDLLSLFYFSRDLLKSIQCILTRIIHSLGKAAHMEFSEVT